MPKQLEMLQQRLSIKPSLEFTEPRLWARRLVIWESLDEPPIRQIKLRPGMNIVWTPDESGIGHGGGKTLFCRLLRYCLGEDTFAPSDQRNAIGQKIPEGWVGAEVIINKQPWGVLRPIGNRRTHFAVPDVYLEDLVSGQYESTGIKPLTDAIEESILTDRVKAVIPNRRQGSHAWPIALAWLTRDQECRFDHVLDWRSPVSESDSPASGLNKQERLQVLRALLGAINAEEQDHRRELLRYREESSQANTLKSHIAWEIERLKKRLRKELSIPQEKNEIFFDDLETFQTALEHRFLSRNGDSPNKLLKELASANEEYENSKNEVTNQEKRKEILENNHSFFKEIISALEGEYPRLFISTEKAEEPFCPICEVKISRVMAEGCNLSEEFPDLAACRRRMEKNREKVEEQTRKLEKTNSELSQFDQKLVRSMASRNEKLKKLTNLEKQHELLQEKLTNYKILERDISALYKLTRELLEAEDEIEEASKKESQQLWHVNEHLKLHDKAIAQLNEKLQPITQYFLGDEATAEARLNRTEIAVNFGLGGNRSTSAIDSLKVIAFDLSALCLSIEGRTASPPFLLHDSPREADLGLPLYQKIFYLIHDLETLGETPLFQYIITTTTPPPSEFSGAPWMILEISGSPASNRLLKIDL